MKRLNVIFFAAIIVAVGVLGYSSYQKKQKPALSELAMANVEALTQSEGGNDPLPGNQSDCHSKGGAWNSMSICEASGFESAVCKYSGKISAFGIEISGNFEKGKKYNIAWARYRCVDSNGNCCIKQGMYTGTNKLA